MVLRKHSDLLFQQLLIGPNDPSTNTEVCHEYLQHDRLLGRLSRVPSKSWLGLVGLVWVGLGEGITGNFPILSTPEKLLEFIEKRCIDKKKSGHLTQKYPTNISPVCLDFTFEISRLPKELISGPPFILTRLR